jgi:hypothetical protein
MGESGDVRLNGPFTSHDINRVISLKSASGLTLNAITTPETHSAGVPENMDHVHSAT